MNDYMKKYKIHNPSTIAELGDHRPMYMVLTEESFSYDDGYGDHGSSSRSTYNALKPQFFYSQEELQEWLDEQHKPDRYGSPPKYAVFSVERAAVHVQTVVNFKP